MGGVYLASFSFRLVGDTKGQVDGNGDTAVNAISDIVMKPRTEESEIVLCSSLAPRRVNFFLSGRPYCVGEGCLASAAAEWSAPNPILD